MLDALGLKTHFKAIGDGKADDWHAINDWLAQGIETGRPLYAEAGHYATGGKAITVNLAGCREDGLVMMGAGRKRSVFELADVGSEVPFSIVCKRPSGDDCADEFPAFDSEFSRFGIVTRIDGPGLQLGQDGCGGDQYHDALNSCYFEKLGSDNSADSKDNVAVRVNYVLQSMIDIKANCHGRPDKRNKGIALQLRHSAFNMFSGSYCNADTCMEISDDSSFGNFFNPLDFEEATVAVRVLAEGSRNNVMMAPHLGTKHGFSCQAGEKFVVVAPNEGLRCEDYDESGNIVGHSKGELILHGKGLEFVSLLNAHDYVAPTRFDRKRGSGQLQVVRA